VVRRTRFDRAVSGIIGHDDQSFERALRRFEKKCARAGV
jgi:ribosomal protein S21